MKQSHDTLAPLPLSARDDLVGRRLDGKFELCEPIGRGASGCVFRAVQVALGRAVAVKVFGPVGDGDADMVRRFHAEAYAASRLRHPNVVSIHDYGQTADGLLYIAMELLSGRTLRELLQDEFPLAPGRAIDLMAQVLSGMEEAHAAGVVHADLKADNVVVERLRGGGDLAKVIDFGIARMARVTIEHPVVDVAPDDEPRRRIATQVTGTPEYMAPEVIAGEPPTRATDIYSAGVLLYELLTGVLPFTGDSVPAVLARHLEDALEPLSVRFPELVIPRELEAVTFRAMSKRPEDRFPDAASFREAVLSCAADGTASAICEVCGARYGARFRYCSECGVRLSVEANSGDRARREVQREQRKGLRALERGDASRAIKALRGAVGMAIRLGDVDLIASCYHALARTLAAAGAVDASILELEEAVLLVTAGDASGGPDELWRLLVLLAELYHLQRRDREALDTASRALSSARRVSSSHGRQAAQTLMARLYTHARQALRRGPRPSAADGLAGDEPDHDRADTIDAILEPVELLVDEETQPWVPLDATEPPRARGGDSNGD